MIHEKSRANSKIDSKEDQVKKLLEKVDHKVDLEKRKKENETLKISYLKILLTFADKLDFILLFFGYLLAIASGILGPIFVILEGHILNSFDNTEEDI